MSLRDQSVTLTGLELVRVLRAFADSRCDQLGLQGHDDWSAVVDARAEDEEAFLARLAEFQLRGDLRSLVAAKDFARRVVDGEPMFTRQGE